MHIDAYSVYFLSDTYTKSQDFVDLAEHTYKAIEPQIVSNLHTIFCSRQFFVPYTTFLECTENITDIEKKLLAVSLSCTEALTKNGYDAVYIRTIVMDYDEYIQKETQTEIDATNTIQRYDNKITQGLCYFTGSVIKSSPIKPYLHFLTYKCDRCKLTHKKVNDNEKPKFCKCNKLVLQINEPKNTISDYREVKLSSNIDGIVWYNEPKLGDVIEGIGIVKMKSIGHGEYKKYIDIVSWRNTTDIAKTRNDCIQNETSSDIDILCDNASNNRSKEDSKCDKNATHKKKENYYRTLAQDEKLIHKIANLVFADIHGYKNIKTAITLAFFGGSIFSQRSTIHLLLVGDPGLGKSKFLSIASRLLPKSIYTCSTTATSAGLTLSCNDDENINAGCVALCNDGICCIDEFDKLKDPRILYEVMENGTMTYNKGGMYYQVNIDVSIVAAANPQGGAFGEDTNVKKNVKFENAMLNRFDLVFVMLEEFDEDKMRKIIGLANDEAQKDNITSYACNKDDIDDAVHNNLDIDTLKEYVLYCRENISPVLSSKAKQRIKQYWKELRNKSKCTIQVLLTLKRLTEARAKINCREVASLKDAEFAISLHKETQIVVKKKGKFLDDLRERKGEIVSKAEIEQMMQEYNVKQNVDAYIEKLNYQGIIIKKGKDQYKIMQ